MSVRHGTVLLFVASLAAAGEADSADPLEEGLVELRVRALVMALHESIWVRPLAASCLARLGSAGEQELLQGLTNGNSAAREACARALAHLEQPSEHVVPALTEALDPVKRDSAHDAMVRALVLIAGRTASHRELFFAPPYPRGRLTRREACLGLALSPPDDRSARVMVAGLTDRDQEIRATAIKAIACGGRNVLEWERCEPVGWESFWEDPRFAGHWDAAAKALLRIVRTEGAWGREHAVLGLARAKTAPDGWLDGLLAVFRDAKETPEVRTSAAVTLAAMVEKGDAPVSLLAEMLEKHRVDWNWRDRAAFVEAVAIQHCAAEAAWRLGSRSSAIVPALRAVWKDLDSTSARAVAGTLGKLDAATDEMIAYLASEFASRDDWDRLTEEDRRSLAEYLHPVPRAYALLAAVVTEGKQLPGPPRDLPPEDAIRAMTAFPERREETARLLRGLKDGSWWVRFRVIEALQVLGMGDESDRRQLVELIEEASDYRRRVAAEFLRTIDPGWRDQLLILAERAAARGDSQGVVVLLPETGPLPAWAGRHMARSLRGSLGPQDTVLLLMLGNLPPGDADVDAVLTRAVEDPCFNVRGAAGQVLAKQATADEAAVRRVLEVARGAALEEDRILWQETIPILTVLASDPARAKVATRLLEAAASADDDLEFAVVALETIAPDSPVLRDARLRLLERQWDDQYFWEVSRGALRDRRLLRFIVPRLLESGLDSLLWPNRTMAGSPAMSAVVALAESEDDRRRVATTLGAIVEQPESKRTALEDLGRFGGRARAAVPAVRKLVGDPDLGGIAAETLRRIG